MIADRTLLAADCESLTSAGPYLFSAPKDLGLKLRSLFVSTSACPGPLNAVETGKQSRSVLTNVVTRPDSGRRNEPGGPLPSHST